MSMYDTSYPPELWETPPPLVGGAGRRTEPEQVELEVATGEPGEAGVVEADPASPIPGEPGEVEGDGEPLPELDSEQPVERTAPARRTSKRRR